MKTNIKDYIKVFGNEFFSKEQCQLIISSLNTSKKTKQILITTTTLSSSNIFKRLKLKKTIHQFFPIDNKYTINKFIKYWKPSIFFLCESEIWPNLIESIYQNKIKLVFTT